MWNENRRHVVSRARVVIILEVTTKQLGRVFEKKRYAKRGFGLTEVGKIFIHMTYFMYDNIVLNAPNREGTMSYLRMWAEA